MLNFPLLIETEAFKIGILGYGTVQVMGWLSYVFIDEEIQLPSFKIKEYFSFFNIYILSASLAMIVRYLHFVWDLDFY